MDAPAPPPEPPPARFNMARYCLGAGPPRDPGKTGLILVADVDAPETAERWTFAELDDAARRVAAGLLAAGLRPGERLVIAMPNSGDYLLLFFGAIAAGIVPLPVSSLLTPAELGFLIADAEPAAVAVAGGPDIPAGIDVRTLTESDVAAVRAAPPLPAYADTAADDPAFLIYTSGTSRRPKGVLHAQRNVWGRRPTYAGWSGIGASDVMLHAGAFNWSYTLSAGLADPWANGATAVLYRGPRDASVWPKLIAGLGATLFAAVPGIYRQILKQGDIAQTGTGRLRHGLVAGEAPPPGLCEEWTGRTGRELHEAIGMSELSTFISTSPSVPRRPGAIGRPQPGRSVVVLDPDGGTEPLPAGTPGLLAAHRSDPGLMLGYWNRPEEEAEVLRGDWFIGGDLASLDADGYVSHHGRANDIMKAGGYRVSPQEVEAAIAGHDSVAEVACTEVRVRADVSIIAAFVVAKPGASRDAAAIKAYAAERLATYKQPREVVFVEQLPRTPNGKLKRAALSLPAGQTRS
jgi:acyl-coenzyme A synthetase/AMP-(fatty) acid ligase